MATQTCLERKSSAGAPMPHNAKSTLRPVADVVESETGVDLILDLPGVSQDNLNLTVEQDTLTVTGHRETELTGTAVYRENRARAYHRVFHLGEDLDTDTVTAVLKDGVLTVHIPKGAKARPRRIEIAGS